MTVALDWKGDRIAEEVHKAELGALDVVAEDAVARAKSSHPGWRNVTGASAASIHANPAERTAKGARVEVGSDLPHFIFLEIGARGRAGDATLRRAGDGAGAKLPDRLRERMPK